MTELLALSGKELERELERIIKENPASKRRWTQKEREIVDRLHAKGVPIRVIAKELGRSVNSVYAFIEKRS